MVSKSFGKVLPFMINICALDNGILHETENGRFMSWFFCLMALGPEDDVAEYYQQQVEMLEGFNEMDALAEHGFIPK